MLNKTIIQGRLTRDPELRRTSNGIAVTSVALAVERDHKEPDGTKKADYIDVVAWRGTAEMLAKYFTKGRMALVEGRLQIRDWTDNDGNKRRATEVIADSVYFCDSKPNNGNGNRRDSLAERVEDAFPVQEISPELDDDNLPF